MRVIRSCGPINDSHDKKREQERMLKASWDYWERQGLDHPEKRVVTNQLITPMGDNHETK